MIQSIMAKESNIATRNLLGRVDLMNAYIPICIVIITLIVVFSIFAWNDPYRDGLIQNFIGFNTLLFAMFVGYFAFTEFRKKRKGDFLEEAKDLLYKQKDYPNAILAYEKAYALGEKDVENILNMSELYSITGKTKKAREFATLALRKDDSYSIKLKHSMLRILSYIVDEDIDNLKNEISSLIKLSKTEPRTTMGWNYNDTKKIISKIGGIYEKIFNTAKELFEGKITGEEFEINVSKISWLS